MHTLEGVLESQKSAMEIDQSLLSSQFTETDIDKSAKET